ncbi:DUF6193 family natural product biosynthesis protein [Actinomadura sp. 9N215]|uniref:DUF6193 family natural product biosynthesis protein n=1 Tax=Actinomadura sp. 9N215 TaxID=3375150 RepID=UPI0037A9107D
MVDLGHPLNRADQDGYMVEGRLRNQTVGPAATAAQAIAMVVQRLPPDCGPCTCRKLRPRRSSRRSTVKWALVADKPPNYRRAGRAIPACAASTLPDLGHRQLGRRFGALA